MAATPRLAAMAISWITGTGMSAMATKPTVSEARATVPGSRRRRRPRRAASSGAAPAAASARAAPTIWTPWLTPIANTRNGTRIDMGSIP